MILMMMMMMMMMVVVVVVVAHIGKTQGLTLLSIGQWRVDKRV